MAAPNHPSSGSSKVKATSVCSIRTLPVDQQVAAAALAVDHNPANAPMVQMPAEDIAIPFSPSHLAVITSRYWGARGVNLTVSFMDNPEAALRARIVSHMNAWGVFANVQFHEVASGGQVRIARFTPPPEDGYWSYLGTDILHIAQDKPTMNLQDFSMDTEDSEFYRVVRHETGHTLGFPHEHMLEGIVKKIDPAKAIALFGGPPNNWPKAEVIQQVLTALPNSALKTSGAPDPQSIMCYQLPASIMKDNEPILGGTDINARDGAFAATLYPKFTAGPPT